MGGLARTRHTIASVLRVDGRPAPVMVLTQCFKAAEIATVILAGLCAVVVGYLGGERLSYVAAAGIIVASALILFETFRVFGLYALSRLSARSGHAHAALGALFLGLATPVLCLTVLGYPNETIARTGATMGVASGLAVLGLRTISAFVLHGWLSRGRLATRVGVVGASPVAAELAASLSGHDRTVDVVGWYAHERGASDLDALLRDCRSNRLDAVILAVPPTDTERLITLQHRLGPCAQDLYVLPGAVCTVGPAARPAALGYRGLLLVRERPLKGWGGVIKSVFDRTCALLLLIVLAPALLTIAALIRLETPGPVLFRQPRVGYNNHLFPILKFRSMHHAQADLTASRQTTRDDKRITRVGAVIRKLSLDELPQLLNVLSGDMSLVGPRPHAPGTSVDGTALDELVEVYACRHLVKPGITGLAQVRGFRGALHTMEQFTNRLDADLEYIGRRSLWLDVQILVLTVVREVRSRTAY